MRKVDEENIEEDSEGELVIGGRRLTNLRYADDTTLIANGQEKAKKIFKEFSLPFLSLDPGIHLDQVKDFTFWGSIQVCSWRLH